MIKIRNKNVLLIRSISENISFFQFKEFENLNLDIVSYFGFRASDFSFIYKSF